MSTATTTIQAVNNHGEILDERTATTPAAARRSLLAMIDRHCSADWTDSISHQVAARDAAAWDGRTDFVAAVASWNRARGITFHASVGAAGQLAATVAAIDTATVQRDRLIMAMRAEGASLRQIGAACGMSAAGVKKVVDRA